MSCSAWHKHGGQADSHQRAQAHSTLPFLFMLVSKTSGQIPGPFIVESRKRFQVWKGEVTEAGVNILNIWFGVEIT